MNLAFLIKEELEQYISEILDDTVATPEQQKVKSLTKDAIVLNKKSRGTVTQFEIGFLDPQIDALFLKTANNVRPAIMIDVAGFNDILMIEPLPEIFRNLGLGKKLYEKLSDILGFISSSPVDKMTGERRTEEASRVFDSLKRVSSSHYIEFPNGTIFLISPNITDEQEAKMIEYFRKTNTPITNIQTNLPPNWIKGLSMMI